MRTTIGGQGISPAPTPTYSGLPPITTPNKEPVTPPAQQTAQLTANWAALDPYITLAALIVLIWAVVALWKMGAGEKVIAIFLLGLVVVYLGDSTVATQLQAALDGGVSLLGGGKSNG